MTEDGKREVTMLERHVETRDDHGRKRRNWFVGYDGVPTLEQMERDRGPVPDGYVRTCIYVHTYPRRGNRTNMMWQDLEHKPQGGPVENGNVAQGTNRVAGAQDQTDDDFEPPHIVGG